MNYFIDLFSSETAKLFQQPGKDISGFRISKKTYIENQKIGPVDRFICYVMRLQRFVDVLEVKRKSFVDEAQIPQILEIARHAYKDYADRFK